MNKDQHKFEKMVATSQLGWITGKYLIPIFCAGFTILFFYNSYFVLENDLIASLRGLVIFTVFSGVASWSGYFFSFVTLEDQGIMVRGLFDQIRIEYAEIETVSGPYFIALKPVRIKLKHDSSFGRAIYFPAPFFGSDDIVSELKSRILASRAIQNPTGRPHT